MNLLVNPYEIIMYNTDEQVITKHDLEKFKNNESGNKINRIWNELISLLPLNLEEEAKEKGFILQKLDEMMGLTNFYIEVNNPSKGLQKELNKLNLFIICIND